MTRLLLLFLLLMVGCSSATKIAAPDSLKEKSEDLAFELALQGLVKDSHDAEMKALEAQKEVLARIETSLSEIDTKLEASSKAIESSKSENEENPSKSATPPLETKTEGSEVVKSGDEFDPEPQDDPQPTNGWADNALVRQPGPTWNWEGQWNVSVSTAEDHLREHGIVVDGFPIETLKIIHDNVHNGYGYLYGLNKATKTTQTVTRSPQVIYYSTPRKASRRTVRYSTCPNGRCPQ